MLCPQLAEPGQALEGEFRKPYYRKLFEKVAEEYRTRRVYPPAEDIFNAFHFTPLEQVKVVILGQDPYHGEGQAQGLCFSVRPGVEIPPSLVNIYRELEDDLGCYTPNNGCLEKWARQGVPAFEYGTDSPRSPGQFSQRDRLGAVHGRGYPGAGGAGPPHGFYPLGTARADEKAMLHNPRHLVLEAPHPSPLSAFRGFFGSRPFSRTNEYLVKNGLEPIDWQIENIIGQDEFQPAEE